jgi:hypothetical protein
MACENTQPTTTTYCPNNICDEVCVELIYDKCIIHKGADIVCNSPVLLIKEGDKLDGILQKLVDSICNLSGGSSGCGCTMETLPGLLAALSFKENVHGYYEFNEINADYVLPSPVALVNKVFYITQIQGFRTGNRLKGPLNSESFRTLNGSTVSPNYTLNNVISLTISSNGTQYIILNEESESSIPAIQNQISYEDYVTGYQLPNPTLQNEKVIYVKNNNGYNLITAIGGSNILREGYLSGNIQINPYEVLGFYSNGANWTLVSDKLPGRNTSLVNLITTTSYTVYLPITQDSKGATYNIIKNNTPNVQILQLNGSGNIYDLDNTFATTYTTGAETRLSLYCDGSNWYVMSKQ